MFHSSFTHSFSVTPSEDPGLTLPSPELSDQNGQGKRKRELSEDYCPNLLRKANQASSQINQEEPLTATVNHWQPAPKGVERTLTLLPLNPAQLIKRPVEDQPVVVLNHPDADIPEVINVMEVIHRYKGEIQKVVLSHKTLKALSATDGQNSDPTNAEISPAGHACLESSVQERFILKLRLRRVSLKKYQVVSSASHCSDVPVRFRCWFCGRVFASQEVWMRHRQRHLIETESPNCEKNVTSPTLDN